MTIRELITPQWVKDRFLFGVDLTRDDGTPFPDEMFELAIDAAIEMVEDELDIVLDATTVTAEKHDTFGNVNGAPNFGPLRLRKRPVRSVTGLVGQWGQNAPQTYPVEWANMGMDGLDFTGSMTIIPAGDATVSLSSYGLIPGLFRDVSPLWWRVSYLAGWADALDVPKALQMVIGWTAAVLPLDTAGDLIAGAGIASKSVSIDGLSTSISTTSSATNAGYGARLLSYQKQARALLTSARSKYQVRELFAV